MEDVGIELWLLIERLAKKSPSSLIKELCYRTNEAPPSAFPAGSTNPAAAKRNLRTLACYASLKKRYAEAVSAQYSSYNVKGMLAEMLKPVCPLSEGLTLANSQSESSVVRFVQEAAEEAMGDASSGRFNTNRFPQVWSVLGRCLVGTSLAAPDLVAEIERVVIQPNICPTRWWTDDFKGSAAVYKLTKVAMIKDPATMELQYEVMSSDATSPKLVKGRRVIHLEEELHPTTPPTALALVGRRLAQSHGFLFRGSASGSSANSPKKNVDAMENSILRKTSADAEILKWLTKLHQLVKFGRVSAPSNLMPASAMGSGVGFNSTLNGGGGGMSSAGSTFTKPPFPTAAASAAAAASSDEPQQADVGLLYRDPEAAMRNVDLNKADDYTIQEFKAKMSEGFASNVVKPGDPGYKYDVRVEMKTTGASEWDSD